MSYPAFDEVKEVTEVDLDQLYPPEDYTEEELFELFKTFLDAQHEPSLDNGIFAFHQVIFYCIDHGFMRLGKLIYLAMEEPSCAFICYAAEKNKLSSLLFFLNNKLYDEKGMTKQIADIVSDAFINKFPK